MPCADCGAEHENPLCQCSVTAEERSALLSDYLERFREEFGQYPKLMPLDEEGKAPIIQGKCKLDTQQGHSYLVDHEEAIRRIREEGFRGFCLYAGKESHNTKDVVFVDVDEPDSFPLDAFPETLSVLSGSGRGPHWTFRNDGTVERAKGKNGIDGEIRAKNWYVVTPGSIHPSGGIYHVIGHHDIATLTSEQIPEPLQPAAGGTSKNTPAPLPDEKFTSKPTKFGYTVEEFATFDDKLDNLISVLNPRSSYPSVSEADFAFVSRLLYIGFERGEIASLLRSHRNREKLDRDDYIARTIDNASVCDSPLDPAKKDGKIPYWKLKYAAVAYNVLAPDEFEQKEGGSEESYIGFPGHEAYAETLDVLEAEGIEHGRDGSSILQEYELQVLPEHRTYDRIEDVAFPQTTNFTLDKPPREGGSYAVIMDAIEKSGPTVILGSRHSILSFHTETLRDSQEHFFTAVHYEGYNRVCDCGNPENCSKTPYSGGEFQEYKKRVRRDLDRKTVLTADDCPDRLCAGVYLKVAAQEADIVLTVPQLLPNLDRDWSRANLVIDEEQTLDYFRPSSAELVSVGLQTEPDGTHSAVLREDQITREYQALKKLKAEIEAEQERRKEKADSEDREWRRNSYEIDIVAAIDFVEDVRNVLGITAAQIEQEDEAVLEGTIKTLKKKLLNLGSPERRTDPDQLREKITELTARFHWDDSRNPDALLEAILFPYEDQPFHWKQVGGEETLRVIGGRHLFHADILNEFGQIGVIAGPEGELFLDELEGEAVSIEIEGFRYEEDFVILPIGKEDEEQLESPQAQRRRVGDLSKWLNDRAVPHIAVAGTRARADVHASRLSDDISTVVGNPDPPSPKLFAIWSIGGCAIIYENSVVSRGIDVPFFDVTVVVDSGFATPYWEARKEYYRDQDRDEFLKAAAMEGDKKARELTNSVLRMAPTREVKDDYGTKFIVVPDYLTSKIRYLQNRIGPRFESAGRLTAFLNLLTVAGDARLGIDTTYHNLGDREKVFIELASRETIPPERQERPSYSLEEIKRWTENNWLQLRRPVERVLKELDQFDDPPTTTELNNQLFGMENGEIKAAMTVLEGKGIVERDIQQDGTPGRPSYRWRLTGVNISPQ